MKVLVKNWRGPDSIEEMSTLEILELAKRADEKWGEFYKAVVSTIINHLIEKDIMTEIDLNAILDTSNFEILPDKVWYNYSTSTERYSVKVSKGAKKGMYFDSQTDEPLYDCQWEEKDEMV